jgi:hypothetical protein
MVLDPDDLIALADEELAAQQAGARILNNQASANQPQSVPQEFSSPEQTDVMQELQLRQPAPAPIAEEPQISRQEQMMSELKKLQDQQRRANMWAGVMEGSAKIGQAFAGQVSGKFDVTPDIGKGLRDGAALSIQQHQDRLKAPGEHQKMIDEMDANDPKSDASKKARELAESQGIITAPGMSAKRVDELLKTLSTYQGLKQGSQKTQLTDYDITDAVNSRDPNHPTAEIAREVALKAGIPAKAVAGKSRWDIEQLLKMYKEAKGNTPAETFLPQAYYDENDKTTKIGAFSNRTGLIKPTNSIKGYAPKTDLNTRTGEKEVFVPGTGKSAGPAYGGPSEAPTPEQAPNLNRDNLNVKQQERLDKSREDFMKDSDEDRKAVAEADGIINLLNAGEAMNGDILRAIQTKFARASGEKGAMTEQDVAPYGGRQAVLDRIERSLSMWVNGKLPDDDRKFLASLANTMKQRSQENIKLRSEFFVNNMTQDLKSSPALKGANFDRPEVSKLIGVDSAAPAGDGMVEVISAKTGKKHRMPKDKVEDARKKGLIK